MASLNSTTNSIVIRKAPAPSRALAVRTLQLAFAAASATSSASAFTVHRHAALTSPSTSSPSRHTSRRIRAPRVVPAAPHTSTTALGVASFRPPPSSGTAPGGDGGDDDDEHDVSIEDLRRQADELEELLKRTSTFTASASTTSQREEEVAAVETTFDPFEIETSAGGEIASAAPSPSAESQVEETRNRGALGFLPDGVWSARLLVIVAAALYGTNFSVVKILDETMPVGISSTLRFAMAALATLPWLLAPSSSAPKKGGDEEVIEASTFAVEDEQGSSENKKGGIAGWWDGVQSDAALAAGIAGFEVGLWNSIGYIAQAVGLETTEAGKSAFICSLAVVIVPILDFFAGKKFLPRELVGAAMAVLGVGLLEFGGGGGLHSLSSGDVASLVQPLAFGMGFWRMEDAMHRHPDEATRATAGQMLAVFAASAVFCLLSSSSGMGETALPPVEQVRAWLTDPAVFGALLWTGVVTTALTVYMETLALKTLSAAETTMIFSTEPLWGAAFAAAVLGERFGPEAAVGAGLILTGIAYSNVGLDRLLKSGAECGGEEEGTERQLNEEDEMSSSGGGSPTSTRKTQTSSIS